MFPFRHISDFALLTVAIATSPWISTACGATSDVPELPGWRLVWHDEFDGPAVDTKKWEVLKRSRSESHNNEKQFYRPEQATIVDGKLRISATNEPFGDAKYRSARLESYEALGPGRYEARVDLPTTQGMWPAFWLFPNNPKTPWPTGGEIDIMENRGSQPNLTSSAYHWQFRPGPCCDLHEFVVGENKADSQGKLVDYHDGFHVYAVEWDNDHLSFFVDGRRFYEVAAKDGRQILPAPKNIVLNLAVGGDFGGDPNEKTVFPQTMDVDYVRVWQRAAKPGPDK